MQPTTQQPSTPQPAAPQPAAPQPSGVPRSSAANPTVFVAGFALAALSYTLPFCAMLFCAMPAWAVPSGDQGVDSKALTHQGEILESTAGTWGELFPDSSEGPDGSATPVLVLDSGTGEVPTQRRLVPGTDDGREERAPRLVYEAADDTAILLWQSAAAGKSSFQLRFATLGQLGGDEAWSTIHTVEGPNGPVLFDEPPLMTVTRDRFDLEPGDSTLGAIHVRYTIVHLLWRGGGGSLRYTALPFMAGAYVGWHETIGLGDHLRAPSSDAMSNAGATALAPWLAHTTELAVAADGALRVTFANPSAQRLGTVEIRPLPVALSVLGDQVREAIYAAADLFDPNGDMTAFSDKIKGSIIVVGHRSHFNPAVTEYLAHQVHDWLGAHGSEYSYADFLDLGDDVRDLAIDVAHSVYASPIDDPAVPGSTILEIDVGALAGDGADDTAPAQLLDFRELINLPAPPDLPLTVDGAEGTIATSVHTSPDGHRLLIAWQGADDPSLTYVESLENGQWGAQHVLDVGVGRLADKDVQGLLASRVKGRR